MAACRSNAPATQQLSIQVSGRRFEFDIPVDAAPAVQRTDLPHAAGQVVAHQGHDGRLFARRDQIGDVVFVDRAVVLHMRHGLAVHPEPALRADSADFQPDPLALPGLRDGDGPPIPGGTHIDVPQRIGIGIPRDVPDVADPRFSDALGFPAPGTSSSRCPVQAAPGASIRRPVPRPSGSVANCHLPRSEMTF